MIRNLFRISVLFLAIGIGTITAMLINNSANAYHILIAAQMLLMAAIAYGLESAKKEGDAKNTKIPYRASSIAGSGIGLVGLVVLVIAANLMAKPTIDSELLPILWTIGLSMSVLGFWLSWFGRFKKKDIPNNSLEHSQPKNNSIKIRCANCKTLNEEDAKFCKSCGKTM